MNTSTASVRNSAIRFASSAAAAMLLGAALLPATASAADGTITFTGTIYEAPCDFADNSVTCYSGTQRQAVQAVCWQQQHGHRHRQLPLIGSFLPSARGCSLPRVDLFAFCRMSHHSLT